MCMGVDTKLVIPTDLFVWSVKCVCSVSAYVSKFSRKVSQPWNGGCTCYMHNAMEPQSCRFVKTATLSDNHLNLDFKFVCPVLFSRYQPLNFC